jgi:ATP-dependent helicase/nuclease subunit A
VYSREANYGDVAVLVPARTHLKTLLKEFESVGVPYRSNDPSIVYNRPLIAGIRDAVSVVAKSDDQAKIWGALKSPLFGFSDQVLFDHRQAGGGWYLAKDLKDGDPLVNSALELMYELSESAKSANPAWLISELVQRQQLFQVLLHDELGEFEASCLRMIVAHAQQWLSEGNIGLLSYLEWVDTMLSESTRATLPEPDDLDFNAVQIMTVHASKGLEFPITAVTAMAGGMQANRPKLLFIPAETKGDLQIEFSLLAKPRSGYYCSEGYDSFYSGQSFSATLEELSRQIYVACTRAQDHLILSVLANPSKPEAMNQSRGRRLSEASHYFTTGFETFIGHMPVASQTGSQLAKFDKLDSNYVTWLDSLRELSAQSTMRAPSSHEPAKQTSKPKPQYLSKDEGLPDGRPLGRAVHGVMELVMLGATMPSQETVNKFINQLVEREQIEDQRVELETRISKLLSNSEIIEALETQDRWPELHLAKKVDEGSIRFVEGFADLVYKASDGYVLVDYKTDADLKASMDHYREQLGAYADIIEEITGEKIARVLIIHARLDEAETVPLEV